MNIRGVDSSAPAPAFGLSHDAWGRLTLIDAAGDRHLGVEPVRAFPFSDPRRWISLVSAEGKELVLIPALDELPAAVGDLLEEEFARRDFLPVISRIVSARLHSEPAEWEVETDRGPTRFVLRSGDDVRRLGPYRALILDTQGVRYLVEDARRLDAASRRVIEHYL